MKVISCGAVLWDFIGDRRHIGGAPFNVCAHLAKLGEESAMLTRIGRDALGDEALRLMVQLGVNTGYVQVDSNHPTGWGKVDLDDEGVAQYTFAEEPAYEFIEAHPQLITSLHEARIDAFCFSTMEQKGGVTRQTLRTVLERARPRHVLFDVNVRIDFYPRDMVEESLSTSTIVKLNDEELGLVSRRLYDQELAGAAMLARLRERFPVEVLCVTRGEKGCSVYCDQVSQDIEGIRVQVKDTVGSGDAFSAAFLSCYVRTGDAVESARRGTRLGAYVASRSGAVPEYSEQAHLLARDGLLILWVSSG